SSSSSSSSSSRGLGRVCSSTQPSGAHAETISQVDAYPRALEVWKDNPSYTQNGSSLFRGALSSTWLICLAVTLEVKIPRSSRLFRPLHTIVPELRSHQTGPTLSLPIDLCPYSTKLLCPLV
ncbi:hypothetical protein CLAIMM_07783, partial [Cladophialophora immunda]